MIRSLLKKPSASTPAPEYAGNCDGAADGVVHGWAWQVGAPETRVEVEQWVDGVLKARALADLPRGDLMDAGVGDGAYAWRMLLALDPRKTEPQAVEVRFKDGGLVPSGAFEIIYEEPKPPPAPVVEPEPEPEGPPPPAVGHCDGVRDGAAHGWAWRPAAPEEQVIVEQWVEGMLVDETLADIFRADLEAGGVGHGAYGWSTPLKLDPEKVEPQSVELRIRDAGLMADGAFEVTSAEVEATRPATDEAADAGGIVGRCDGLKGSALYGWAWDPTHPDDPVEVELWIEGECVARAHSDQFRPDLRSNRVGTGRYGFRLPVDLRRTQDGPLEVEVRAAGAPLPDGVLVLKNDFSLDDPDNAALRPFVEAVLHGRAQAPVAQAEARPALACLAYCPPPTEPGPYWMREYDDYPAALRAFAPALAQLGEVVVVESLEEAAEVCAARREQGGESVLFAFGPPRQTPLETPCPMIPVFAWGFPAIPTASWDGDPRSDWRNVLAYTGRAITFSASAAEAVRAAMGADFPVVAIPPPVSAEAPPPPAPEPHRTLRLHGVVFDSRDFAYDPEKPIMPARVWTGGDTFADGVEVELEGVLVTTFMDIEDHRKKGADLVSAFIVANRDKADATLLIKLSELNGAWMGEVYKWLAAQPAFACRVLGVRGPLEREGLDAIIAASHWYATAPNAEGLCLPMQDFMAAGRPAIAPSHSALADLVDAQSALVIFSDEEDWRWPADPEDGSFSWGQHPDDVGPTMRHRVSWQSQVDAFAEAYRLATAAPKDYARLAAAAARKARETCSVTAAAAAIGALLTHERPRLAGPSPSPLMRELAAE
jgi:hypothetical protein